MSSGVVLGSIFLASFAWSASDDCKSARSVRADMQKGLKTCKKTQECGKWSLSEWKVCKKHSITVARAVCANPTGTATEPVTSGLAACQKELAKSKSDLPATFYTCKMEAVVVCNGKAQLKGANAYFEENITAASKELAYKYCYKNYYSQIYQQTNLILQYFFEDSCELELSIDVIGVYE